MAEQPEPDVIPPEEASQILRQAIEEKLGKDWDSDSSSWVVVTSHAYMARLNRGRTNVDFYVDHFDGSVKVEVKEIDQDVGKLFAWIMLVLFAALSFVVARGLGYI